MTDAAAPTDDQQAVVDLAGRLAESLPPFTFTVGPAADGVVSVLVDEDDLDEAREFFAVRPLKVDGDRALPVAARPAV